MNARNATLFDVRLFDTKEGRTHLPGWDEHVAARIAAATTELSALRQAGVRTVVETSPIGARRDLGAFGRMASDADVEIVSCTGIDDAATPEALTELDPIELADVLIDALDVRDGRRLPSMLLHGGGTTSALAQRSLRAVAFAHAETAAPVVVRCAGVAATAAAERLVGLGVDPEQIVLAGLDAGPIRFDVVDSAAHLGVGLGFTRGGSAGCVITARAAAIAYAIRSFGAGRVCVGSAAGELAQLLALVRAFGASDDEICGLLETAPWGDA